MSDIFDFRSLETPELERAADEEAASFSMPPGWQKGLITFEGFAIDGPDARERDDAVNVSVDGEGYIAHIGIVDVSEINPHAAIAAYAQRRLVTTYSGSQVRRSMIPTEISQGSLSFLHGEERPAIMLHIPVGPEGPGELEISRGVMKADNLSPAEINLIPEARGSETHTPIHDLERAARMLYAHRHHGATEVRHEDEDGKVLSSKVSVPQLIVQEFMILANKKMGEYFVREGIPGVFRRHDLSADVQAMLDGKELPRNLKASFARADYTNCIPAEHLGLDGTNVLHFTSPLRRWMDFLNHKQLTAHFNGEDYPFSNEQIEHSVERHRRLTGVDLSEQRVAQELIARREELMQQFDTATTRLNEGSAHETDLAGILFNPDYVGFADLETARRNVFASLIAMREGVVFSVINTAVQKRWAQIKGQHFVPAEGEAVPYSSSPKGEPAVRATELLDVLSRYTGMGVSYEEIREFRAKTAKGVTDFLEKLGSNLGTPCQINIAPGGSEYTCTVSMRINGEVQERTATAPSVKEARREAVSRFISDFDLIDNPPVVSELQRSRQEARQLRKTIKGAPKKHPVVQVKTYCDKQYTIPNYAFSQEMNEEHKQYQTTCTVTVEHDDMTLEVSAIASNKDDAKLLAANKLLKLLPIKR